MQPARCTFIERIAKLQVHPAGEESSPLWRECRHDLTASTALHKRRPVEPLRARLANEEALSAFIDIFGLAHSVL